MNEIEIPATGTRELAAIAIQCGCEVEFGYPVMAWSELHEGDRDRFRRIADNVMDALGIALVGTPS